MNKIINILSNLLEKVKKYLKKVNERLNKINISKKILFVIGLLSIIKVVLFLLNPIIISKIISNIFNKINSKSNILNDKIFKYLIVLIVINVSNLVITYIKNSLIINKIYKCFSFVKTDNNIKEKLKITINFVINLINSILFLLESFIMLLIIDIKYAVIMVLLFNLILFVKNIIKKKLNIKTEKEIENNNYEEIVQNLEMIKLYNAENKMLKKAIRENNSISYNAFSKKVFFEYVLIPFLKILVILLMLSFGYYLYIVDKKSIYYVFLFVIYAIIFIKSEIIFINNCSIYKDVKEYRNKVLEYIDNTDKKVKYKKIDEDKIKGTIEFKNVSFIENKKSIFKDMSLKIKKGQKVFLLGSDKDRKNVFIDLLMNCYDLGNGKILLDNKDINTFSKKEYQKLFLYLSKDIKLFQESILDNYKDVDENIKEEETMNVLEEMDIDHFINVLPNGLNYICNKDKKIISTSEEKLFNISKVLIRKPKILILDDFIDDLDLKSKKIVYNNIEKYLDESTTFILTEKIFGAKDKDLVLIFDLEKDIEKITYKEYKKSH